MEIKKIHAFLRKNNFTENTREQAFYKSIDKMKKRYRFKDFGIFMEVKRNSKENWELLAYGDIRKVSINETGQLTGLLRAIPSYSTDSITKGVDA